MCGIAGVFRFDGRPVERAPLERMQASMRHRGPDDQGLWCDGPVGFAHARLAILDLSPRGHQPMEDPDSGNRIVYNGEIYNFRELRDELEGKGCRFRSECDTEVILAAYRVWGRDCLDRLNGMFALSIFDAAHRELFVARDRLGIKPLYYHVDASRFLFASETKALVRVGDFERRIDRDAVPELVAFRYLAPGRTLLAGVRDLEPGHHLVVSASGIATRRYWDIPVDLDPEPDAAAREEREFRERLASSVRYRLIADVPVGCALSGGVDSSLVTALACEAATSRMKTFTIGFPSAAFDERPWAGRIAEGLGVENESRTLDMERFYELVPAATWHLDEPINHPNSIGIWLLAELARRRVTVLLSGEGGDELMGGYPRFRRVLELRALRRALPGLGMLARLLPPGLPGRVGHATRALARDDAGLVLWSSAFLPSHFVEPLLGPGALARAEERRRAILDQARSDDPLRRHLYYELKTYLVSLLIRMDKMSMAHSLENRVPLLDHRVVEQAFRLPNALKVDRRRGKKLLFRMVEERLGPGTFDRRKMGFGLPVDYFHGAGLDTIRELLGGRRFRERGLVEPRALAGLVDRYETRRDVTPDAIWVLAALEQWARTFVDRPAEIAA